MNFLLSVLQTDVVKMLVLKAAHKRKEKKLLDCYYEEEIGYILLMK